MPEKYSGEELGRQLWQAKQSFRYFLRNHVYIADRTSEGDLRGVLKWRWWPAHESMVADLETHPRLVVAKARQLGMSWMLAARRVWQAMFQANSLHGVVSAGETEAVEFVWKCAFIIAHLPYEPLPTLAVENSLELEFTASHGRIMGFPSTPKAGRGYTFTTFTADEAAFHPYASRNFAAYSTATTGEIAIVSSAGDDERQVLTDWFQRMWKMARNGENGFYAKFYPPSHNPTHTEEWLAARKAELLATPGQFEREHPSTPEEAFASMLTLRFNPDAVRDGMAYAMTQVPVKPDVAEVGDNPYLTVWAYPTPGASYVMATDPAEGKGRDYTTTVVLETRTLRHVATLRDRVQEPTTHASQAVRLARWYNNAFWVVERAKGEAIIGVAMAQGCRLYREFRTPNSVGVPGFPITAQTRPGLIDDLGKVIASRELNSPDQNFWAECGIFVTTDGKPQALKGGHDDLPSAMWYAVRGARQPEALVSQEAYSMGALVEAY